MPETDPLRRLLDVVVEDGDGSLAGMAAGAHLSPFHFQRTVSARTGESPSALRRRVLLERAAWRLQRGTSVTEAAFDAEYDSVDGFSRAFRRAYGCAPSQLPPASERGHWLPSPNGLHFHSPVALYVESGQARESSSGDVVALMVEHDLEDIDLLLEVTATLPEQELVRVRMPGHRPRDFDGAEETIAQSVLHLVLSREPWLASIAGEPLPSDVPPDAVPSDSSQVRDLRERNRRTAARWLAMLREVQRRDACADLTPPALDPDPILWHRRRTGDQP